MITSTEISNLISAQLAAATQAQAFAQSISPVAPAGQGGTADMASRVGMATASASAAAVQAVPAALSAAAWVGGPRAFSPILGTMDAGLAGAASAGTNIGLAASRMIGFGGMAAAGYVAAGGLLKAATDQLMRGAQEQLAVNQMITQAATRTQLPMMNGLLPEMAPAFGSFVRSQALNYGVSAGELTSVIGGALSSGMFRSAPNLSALQAQISDYTGSLHALSMDTGLSMSAGAQVTQQMRELGYLSHRQATGAAMGVYALSTGLGVQASTMLGAGQYGQTIARSMGMPGNLGARVSMGLAGRLGAANLAGGISTEAMADVTGYGTLDESLPVLSAQLTQSAMGAAMNNPTIMAGLIDPETGHISSSLASAFSAGAITSKDLERMARKNMRNKGVRAAMNARAGGLAAELVEQVGPEGLLGGYAQAKLATRGVKAGENPEDVMDMLLQQYGGLGEQQAAMVQELIQAGPSIRSEIQKRVTDEAAMLKSTASFQRNYSLDGIKKKIVDATVGPLVQGLRDVGASLMNAGSEAFQSGVDALFGSDPRFQGRGTVSSFAADQYQRAVQGAPSVWGGGVGGGLAFRDDGSVMGQPVTVGTPRIQGLAGGLASFAPDWVVANGYSPAMSGIGPALMGVGAVGRGMLGLGGRVAAGAFDFSISATSMAARLGGGAALGALGAVARYAAGPLGLGLAAYDLATNVLPALADYTGAARDDAGGITGAAAAALSGAWDAGLLPRSVLNEAESRGDWVYQTADELAESGRTRVAGTNLAVNNRRYVAFANDMYSAMSDPTGYLGASRETVNRLRTVGRRSGTDIGWATLTMTSAEKLAYLRDNIPEFRQYKDPAKLAAAALAAGLVQTSDLSGLVSGLTANLATKEGRAEARDRLLSGLPARYTGTKALDAAAAGPLGRWDPSYVARAMVAAKSGSAAYAEGLSSAQRGALTSFIDTTLNDPTAGNELAQFALSPSAEGYGKVRDLLLSRAQSQGDAAVQNVMQQAFGGARNDAFWGDGWQARNPALAGIVGLTNVQIGDMMAPAQAAALEAANRRLADVQRTYSPELESRLAAIGGRSAAGVSQYAIAAARAARGLANNEAGARDAMRAAEHQTLGAYFSLDKKKRAAFADLLDDDSQALVEQAGSIEQMLGARRQRGLSAVLGQLKGADAVMSTQLADSLAKSVRGGELYNYQMRDVERMLAIAGVNGDARANVVREVADFAKERGKGKAGEELATALAEAKASFRGGPKSGQQVDPNGVLERFISSLDALLPQIAEIVSRSKNP